LEKAFGTLCHQASSKDSQETDDIPIKNESVLENLSEANRAAIMDSAKRLAEGFLNSDLGSRRWRRNAGERSSLPARAPNGEIAPGSSTEHGPHFEKDAAA
jgi:hypothetical protein